ncbi:Exportin 5 [Paramicrosporidium saccamoebae]|uniref:Exportin 5 n=1 Tax=Paramicrosporidium saccamoebae TaxID=1246581 RepID=A0A2H9TLZ6_9FUNG|nr:Exportin 5 [Paramicrosporidium saccamoebae]
MMGEGEQIRLESVVEAVRVILDPSSSTEVRTTAHTLCECVKTHPQAPQLGFQLATIEMPLSARLFGLNVLETFVRTRLVVGEAETLREGVWSLLALVVAVRPEERRLMQDKTAMLVAQLAMRIWPQYWPDFFDKLLQLVTEQGTMLEQDATVVVRTEMGLLMARMVVDEIHPREGSSEKLIWDDTRRPELQKALAVVLPQMMQRISALLPHCSGWSAGEMRLMKPLLESLMEAFGSISLWTILEKTTVIGCLRGILKIAQQSGELTSTALDVLLTFAGRTSRPQEADVMPNVFDAIVDDVRTLLGIFATSADGYEHFKRLADVFVTMAATHMGHKKATCVPSRLDAVLDVLLQLSNFPSLLVVSSVGGLFWNSVAKNEKIMTHPAMTARLSSVFLYALVTLAQNKDEERRRVPYNRDDFEDDEGDTEAERDFEALFSTHQNRTMELLRQIAIHHPATLLQFCSGAISTFLAERPTGLSADLGTVGLRQWDALMHATDCVLKACLGRLEMENVAEGVKQLGTVLCPDNVNTMHPETLYLWFVAMRTLIPALGMVQSAIFVPLMQQLFSLTLSYTVPSAANWPIDKTPSMTFAITARAGTTILRVCHVQPTLFLPALDYIAGLFRQTSTLRERRLFTEMLLIIAGCMEGSMQRVELVRLVLGPVAEALTTLAPPSLEVLLERAGFAELIPRETPAAAEYRQHLMNINSLLYVVLTQLKKLAIAGDIRTLINQFVPPAIAALTQMIAVVHSAYDRRNSAFPERWDAVFGEDALAGDVPATEKLLDAEAMADSMDTVSTKSLRGWFYMLRVSAYMNFGLFGTLGSSALGGALEPVFANCNAFSITQWTLLTKHLAAPMFLASNVQPSQPSMLLLVERFGLVQLEAAWQTFFRAQADQAELRMETALETLLTAATNALLTLLYDVLCPVSERDKRTDPVLDIVALRDSARRPVPEPSHSPLARMLISDEVLCPKIVLLLAAMLRWKAALTLGKTLSILMRWLPLLMERAVLHETLFGPILAALLAALSSTQLGDHHPVVTAALTEFCKWQLVLGYDAMDRQIHAILPGTTIPQNAPGTTKQQRSHVRATLVRPLQQQALSATGITSVLPRLPDRLVVLNKLKLQPEINLDLASFFDQ